MPGGSGVRLRMLHAIRSVNPVGGGPIEAVKQLAAVNRGLGHTIEIASLDPPGAPEVTACPIPVYPLGPSKGKYGYSGRFIPWLARNAGRYDVVIVNGIWEYNSLGAWRALRSSETPYVVFTHGMLDPWFKKTYPLKHLKKMLYWPWASYRVLRDAGAVLFTSNEEQLLAGESFWPYKVRGTVVKYGTRAATGNTESQLEAFFERFPELRGKRLLLFVGRIDPIKGCDLIIRAFSEVLARNRDWHLVMAGPDQNGLRPSLDRIGEEAQVGNRITWTGMIAGDVKFGAFRASEALLLPSHHENFGIAVAESLAYGLPVLISNKVNIWREIQADGGGFVAEDDLAGACQLLRTWEALPVERKVQMRAAAAKCFETRFEIHNAASCLVKTLTEVIERNRPHMLVEQVEG